MLLKDYTLPLQTNNSDLCFMKHMNKNSEPFYINSKPDLLNSKFKAANFLFH